MTSHITKILMIIIQPKIIRYSRNMVDCLKKIKHIGLYFIDISVNIIKVINFELLFCKF